MPHHLASNTASRKLTYSINPWSGWGGQPNPTQTMDQTRATSGSAELYLQVTLGPEVRRSDRLPQ
ncbi:hypothetical protein TIFTF001_034211 [Ficus carica]|uniref:Uncharacterized protein n=1 Tax=Ficus carica TaxID=3494 RepID=A0AA88DZV8_FICCA|nr:hypothetical protein TIFTF001_034211 [Ficus carica]